MALFLCLSVLNYNSINYQSLSFKSRSIPSKLARYRTFPSSTVALPFSTSEMKLTLYGEVKRCFQITGTSGKIIHCFRPHPVIYLQTWCQKHMRLARKQAAAPVPVAWRPEREKRHPDSTT